MSRKYLLDTNAVSDLFNKRRGVDLQAIRVSKVGAMLGTALPVVGELYHGAEASSTRDRNLKLLKSSLRKLRQWPFDSRAAVEYGRIAAELDRRGRPMQQVDIQLAAIALVLGATVVTTDSDLSAVPGLSVEDWTTPPPTGVP